MMTNFLSKRQVWKRVSILEVWSENGCGKLHFWVWNRVRIWSSLRVSSLWRSGGGAGKERKAWNYVSWIWLSASKKAMRDADWWNDISNDVITLDTCFSMFVYTRARFRFVLIGGNPTAQLTKRHRGIEVRIQSPETLLQALLPFPARPPGGIGELARRLDMENRAAHPQLRIHRNSPPPPDKLLPVSRFYPSHLGCLLLATS